MVSLTLLTRVTHYSVMEGEDEHVTDVTVLAVVVLTQEGVVFRSISI